MRYSIELAVPVLLFWLLPVVYCFAVIPATYRFISSGETSLIRQVCSLAIWLDDGE
jgi:hypothetical protein